MNCTFYRPNTINICEFENIVGKLNYDLYLLKTEQQDEWGVYSYFYSLSKMAESHDKNDKMRFLGLADPVSMPTDARVAYVYRPTYIATAFMIKAVLLFPSLMSEDDFLDSELDFTVSTVKDTLIACMRACTGRGFDGAGIMQLKDCVKLFYDAGVDEFLNKYPQLCPEFTELYRERKDFLERGRIDPNESWFNHGH